MLRYTGSTSEQKAIAVKRLGFNKNQHFLPTEMPEEPLITAFHDIVRLDEIIGSLSKQYLRINIVKGDLINWGDATVDEYQRDSGRNAFVLWNKECLDKYY